MATAEIDLMAEQQRKTLAEWKAEAIGSVNASCPRCGCRHFLADTDVYGTYRKGGLMLPTRYRKCRNCEFKVTTQEVIKGVVSTNENNSDLDHLQETA
jgi:hypothetical protein